MVPPTFRIQMVPTNFSFQLVPPTFCGRQITKRCHPRCPTTIGCGQSFGATQLLFPNGATHRTLARDPNGDTHVVPRCHSFGATQLLIPLFPTPNGATHFPNPNGADQLRLPIGATHRTPARDPNGDTHDVPRAFALCVPSIFVPTPLCTFGQGCTVPAATKLPMSVERLPCWGPPPWV
jgi:hypothetical protein